MGVAVFIFFFSLLFQQNQKIALFCNHCCNFSGGSGAVIIGGLYWEKGTTKAAWTAIIIGALISVGGVLVKQVSVDWLSDTSSYAQLKNILDIIRNINGQEYWGISMGASAFSYVLVSLMDNAEPFNMDKLLNRGAYAIEGEKKIINEEQS